MWSSTVSPPRTKIRDCAGEFGLFSGLERESLSLVEVGLFVLASGGIEESSGSAEMVGRLIVHRLRTNILDGALSLKKPSAGGLQAAAGEGKQCRDEQKRQEPAHSVHEDKAPSRPRVRISI